MITAILAPKERSIFEINIGIILLQSKNVKPLEAYRLTETKCVVISSKSV